MAAAHIDLLIEIGSTFVHEFIWQDANETPIDLTNYTAEMDILDNYVDKTILLSLTTENGGLTLGGVLGTIDLLIPASVTGALTWTSGVYDLRLIVGSVKTRLVQGTVTTSEEATS